MINEFYGSAGARFVTFVGFFMAIFAFVVIFVARLIPAAPFSPVGQAAFDNVLGNANRIFVASLVAYLVGQLVDIAIFQSAKRLTQSRHIWLRSTGSTLISQLIDTLIVTYIAFYGKIPTTQLHQRGDHELPRQGDARRRPDAGHLRAARNHPSPHAHRRSIRPTPSASTSRSRSAGI